MGLKLNLSGIMNQFDIIIDLRVIIMGLEHVIERLQKLQSAVISHHK